MSGQNGVHFSQAQRVVYRNARGDEGEGLIPYTIVTYSIETVLRGKPPGKQITMRFVGGSDGQGEYLTVTDVPLIQEGDRDVLFVADTDDLSCPLVFCDSGRYRILNERVFDGAGSPVRAIIEEEFEQRDEKSRRLSKHPIRAASKFIVISGGTPPEEFQTIRFPTPSFDELIQNPEVATQLKSLNMSEDDARRRYEMEAPKFVELKREFPVTENPTDVGPAASGPQPGAPRAPVDSKGIFAPEALPLTEFIAITELVSKQSKRTPVRLRSVDPAAKIVAARATVAAPQRVAPALPPGEPLTRGDAAEVKAFEQNGNNPVIRKLRQ